MRWFDLGMNFLSARSWSRKRYVAVVVMVLVPVVALQFVLSDLDGAAYYIAATVNIVLVLVALCVTFTFTKRADELREERQKRKRSPRGP